MSGKTASLSLGGSRVVRRQGLWRLLILLFIIFIIGCYISPVRSFIERSGQIESERAMTEQLRSEHDNLMIEKESLQDDLYVEQVAREDLGLVKPGEQSYVVKDFDGGQPPATDPLVAGDLTSVDDAAVSQAQPEAFSQESEPQVELPSLFP